MLIIFAVYMFYCYVFICMLLLLLFVCSQVSSLGLESQGGVFYLLFILWIMAAIVSTCYTFTWDIKMDWGLFQGVHKLREELIYPSKVCAASASRATSVVVQVRAASASRATSVVVQVRAASASRATSVVVQVRPALCQ